MRITSNTIFLNLQRQLEINGRQLMTAQERVATQKQLNRMSDDPVAGGRVLDLKGMQSRTTQYQNNIARARDLTTVQDQTLEQASDLIGRAKELLLAESNEASSTAATRESSRIEIATLVSQLVQLGNTQYDGSYIFSGFATTTPAFSDAQVGAAPAGITGDATVTGTRVADITKLTYDTYEIRFTAPGQFDVVDTTGNQTVLSGQSYVSGQPIRFDGIEVTLTSGALGPAAGDVYAITETLPGNYQGDGQTQLVEIQQGARTPQNLTGDAVFQGAGSATGVDLFDIMNRLQQALKNNDRTAMGPLLDELDAASEQISNTRSQVGARMNLLDQVRDRQEAIAMRLESLRSNLEDVDIAKAVTDLNKQQTAYEATIGAAAQIVQPSLLDFLR